MLQSLRKRSLLLVIVLAIGAVCAESARAQSSVFNIPSTDVMPKGTTYLEADYAAHLSDAEHGGFNSYGFSAVHGVRRDLEVGVNAYYTRAGGEALPVEVQPNAKWQFYNNEEKGLAAATGGVLFAPVTRRAGTDTYALVYTTVSKQLKTARGARLTGGAYGLVGSEEEGVTRAGALLGYEQPLSNRLTFIADWYTGRNSLGYSAAGLGITVTSKSQLYVGYNFGNEGRGNNYLGVYYGVTF